MVPASDTFIDRMCVTSNDGSMRGDYQMTSTSHVTYEAVTQQVSLKTGVSPIDLPLLLLVFSSLWGGGLNNPPELDEGVRPPGTPGCVGRVNTPSWDPPPDMCEEGGGGEVMSGALLDSSGAKWCLHTFAINFNFWPIGMLSV